MDAAAAIAMATKLLSLVTEYGPQGIDAAKKLADQFDGGRRGMTLEQLDAALDAILADADMVDAHLQAHQRTDGE